MIYEWDEAKRIFKLAKHGVDFAAAVGFEWETAVERLDARRDYGESRWWAMGMIGDCLHFLVFARREDRIRVISLRRGNRNERISYETEVETGHA